MILKFNATGPKRKELAGLISNFTGCESRYLGAPGFSYEIGRFVIDRNGNVETDYEPGSETVELLTEMLYDNGFVSEYDEGRGYELEVSVPREKLVWKDRSRADSWTEEMKQAAREIALKGGRKHGEC